MQRKREREKKRTLDFRHTHTFQLNRWFGVPGPAKVQASVVLAVELRVVDVDGQWQRQRSLQV